MNLRNVVTIGTYCGGSVGGLEEGKGVQPILGRKNRLLKSPVELFFQKEPNRPLARCEARSQTSCNKSTSSPTSNIPLWHTSTIFWNKWSELHLSDIKVRWIFCDLQKIGNISEFHDLTFLKNGISPGRDFLMFLTNSKYFWHKLNILVRNLKNVNWSLQSHQAGFSLYFWSLPNISGINWTFWSEISKTRIYCCNLTRPGFPYVFDHFQIFLA